MKLNQRALHEALTQLVRIMDRKPTLEILSTVKLMATHGKVTVTSTNLDQWLSTEIPGEGELTICIAAKVLKDLTKPESKGDNGDVTIEVLDEKTITLTVDGLTTQLKTEPVEEFPLPSTDTFNLVAMWPAKPFADSLGFCVPVASDDPCRPHINAVCLDECLAATDGHRLHVATIEHPLTDPLLIPIRAAQALQRVLKNSKDIIIAKSDDRVKMKAGSWTLESKVTQETYPPIDQVIPKNNETEIVIDAPKFTKALKRICSLSKDRNFGVKLTINGVIEMTSANPSVGEATMIVEPVSSNHCSDEEDVVLGINSAYLLDALAKEKERVTMSLSGPLDPVRFDYEDGRVGVVMPMRV
ncbi:MAG: DNA polymerase III subunit beta [Proteobacteria bacterium]|nr:DNA polymerase III subunit beta [Pseudomonadota bacterium]